MMTDERMREENEGEKKGKRDAPQLKNAAPDYGTASLNLPAWLIIC